MLTSILGSPHAGKPTFPVMEPHDSVAKLYSMQGFI